MDERSFVFLSEGGNKTYRFRHIQRKRHVAGKNENKKPGYQKDNQVAKAKADSCSESNQAERSTLACAWPDRTGKTQPPTTVMTCRTNPAWANLKRRLSLGGLHFTSQTEKHAIEIAQVNFTYQVTSKPVFSPRWGWVPLVTEGHTSWALLMWTGRRNRLVCPAGQQNVGAT